MRGKKTTIHCCSFCPRMSDSGTEWFLMSDLISSRNLSKTVLSVVMIYDSLRLPRVRFCEVMMQTLSPFSDWTSSTFEWLSARCVVVITCSMNVHSDKVLFVALKSSTRWIADALSSFVIK